jgi:hypothetical protein
VKIYSSPLAGRGARSFSVALLTEVGHGVVSPQWRVPHLLQGLNGCRGRACWGLLGNDWAGPEGQGVTSAQWKVPHLKHGFGGAAGLALFWFVMLRVAWDGGGAAQLLARCPGLPHV